MEVYGALYMGYSSHLTVLYLEIALYVIVSPGRLCTAIGVYLFSPFVTVCRIARQYALYLALYDTAIRWSLRL